MNPFGSISVSVKILTIRLSPVHVCGRVDWRCEDQLRSRWPGKVTIYTPSDLLVVTEAPEAL